jgi:hypothetical protein
MVAQALASARHSVGVGLSGAWQTAPARGATDDDSTVEGEFRDVDDDKK